MKQEDSYYITTTAPYVNAEPHIGFGLEIVTADVLARYQRMLGKDVAFGYGTDEHGLKIYQNAVDAGKQPQEYVDDYAQTYVDLRSMLNLSTTHFQRTTNPEHMAAAQEIWWRCEQSGDIYKQVYKVKYCVGCELEKTDSELVEGKCPIHPNREIELIEEENYFFRFSKYQGQLLKMYEDNPEFVRPETKLKEIKAFVGQGLRDFSISRLKDKLPWGVPVPGDEEQVMYVWFDALTFYISTLGWPQNTAEFNKYWPGVQVAGKDNLRQQSAMWQAMLMSAGLPNSKQVLINGFISVEGQKMSKSLGNVISPEEMVKRYGVDGARFLLIDLGPITTDMDVSWEKFDERYNATLANALGNTVQRVATLGARSGFEFEADEAPGFRSQVKDRMKEYRLDLALGEVWESISMIERKIDDTQPWKLEGQQLKVVLMELVAHLRQVGYELYPFLPETGEKIIEIFKGPKVKVPTPLFPRLV